MNSIEVLGKNVDQAIEIGLFKLSATRDDVKIIVLEEGGLFDKAKVKLILKSELEKQTASEQIINDFVDSLKLKIYAAVEEKDHTIRINFTGEDIGFIIGKRGDVLDSIQYLLSQIFNKNTTKENSIKVIVDCDGYRNKREESLKLLAKRIAEKVTRTGKPEKLEPMNAYERKIIHLTLEARNDISTISKNEEPNRYITILPVKNAAQTTTSNIENDLNPKSLRVNND